MIRVFKNEWELSVAAAESFIAAAELAVTNRGKFTVALTGGSSPKHLYGLLAGNEYRNKVDWTKVFVFWGDERWVPINDDLSNAGMAKKLFLDDVGIPEDQIFPMWEANTAPQERAEAYEKILRKHLGANGSFDLILSGMGDDGHTASLFPGTEVLKEQTKWVSAYYLEPQKMFRITLTAPLINKAKQNIVLVFGSNKANAFYKVIEGNRQSEKYPSQLLKPSDGGQLVWFADEAAAQKLSSQKDNN